MKKLLCLSVCFVQCVTLPMNTQQKKVIAHCHAQQDKINETTGETVIQIEPEKPCTNKVHRAALLQMNILKKKLALCQKECEILKDNRTGECITAIGVCTMGCGIWGLCFVFAALVTAPLVKLFI